MKGKSFYLNFFAAVIVVLFITFVTTFFHKPIPFQDEKPKTLTLEKIKETDLNINIDINQLCADNGVFLCDSNKSNVLYLIFDGTHINLNDEVPYFSNVKIKSEGDTIEIYFDEERKEYSEKIPAQRLIYKITKDKEYKYIKVFRNGKETYFNGVGA